MSLYAVQVLTGQEAEVCRRLADCRIATLLPQERRLIRRGGAKKLPRYPTRKNRMGRTERILSAPVFVFMLLILILIAILEYFR